MLTGGAGNDTLIGGLGNDTLVGGSGDDKYYVDSTADVVTELAGEGSDAVFSSASFTLSQNVENLVLTGSSNLSGYGNSMNNVLTGNAGASSLFGGDGDDILRSGIGSTNLNGGGGSDRYEIAAAGGASSINNSGGDASSLDVVAFDGADIWSLWFGRKGNDLIVSVVGSSTSATMAGWFSAGAGAVDVVESTSSAKQVGATGIAALVNAMAAFSTGDGLPDAGISPANYAPEVTLAINQSWA